MAIFLYILAAIALLIVLLYLWAFKLYLTVPKLEIPAIFDSESIDTLDDWFTELHEQRKFNGVVLLAEAGEALLMKGYGFTNHEKTERLTEHSSVRLAGISNQFTAAGIMLLHEKKKIQYADLISTYIKGFPYEEVTIRHLLNQTSGVPDIYRELAQREKSKIQLLTNELAVELLIKENRKAKFTPNQEYRYSDTNYMILARIIEIVSGMSFEKYMKVKLFVPLGMKNTRVWNLCSQETSFKNKVEDFKQVGASAYEIEPTFLDGVAGEGAVFSSVRDLLIWDKFWYRNSLIKPSNLKEAFKLPVLDNGKISSYGFGWEMEQGKMWHAGYWLGAKAMFVRDIEQNLCFAILDNSSNIFFEKILEQIIPRARKSYDPPA